MSRIRAGAAVLVLVAACGSGTDAVSVDSSLPPWADEALAAGATIADDLDPQAEADANRELRSGLPEWAGADLIEVRDSFVYEGDPDRQEATGVLTEWSYAVDTGSKCDLAATFEDPMAASGWLPDALETASLDGDGSIRLTALYRDPAYAEVVVETAPATVALRVQAHAHRPFPTMEPGGEPVRSSFHPCRADEPPAPPQPPVDRDAHLAANAQLFESLPIPTDVEVEENLAEAGTAFDGESAIGYVSLWRLRDGGDRGPCELAAAWEEAMAAAGWERFTWQTAELRTSWFFDPPRSVEIEITPGDRHSVMVSVNGAVVGTRQHPLGADSFVPGATPESRGERASCRFTSEAG